MTKSKLIEQLEIAKSRLHGRPNEYRSVEAKRAIDLAAMSFNENELDTILSALRAHDPASIREAAYKAGVEIAARIAATSRPAPTMDEIHAALVEQHDAMLDDMEAVTNKPHEEKTDDEIRRERAAMDRYEKAEREVMRLSYPLWRAQNIERSITMNALCDGRIEGFLPPFPNAEEEGKRK